MNARRLDLRSIDSAGFSEGGRRNETAQANPLHFCCTSDFELFLLGVVRRDRFPNRSHQFPSYKTGGSFLHRADGSTAGASRGEPPHRMFPSKQQRNTTDRPNESRCPGAYVDRCGAFRPFSLVSDAAVFPFLCYRKLQQHTCTPERLFIQDSSREPRFQCLLKR